MVAFGDMTTQLLKQGHCFFVAKATAYPANDLKRTNGANHRQQLAAQRSGLIILGALLNNLFHDFINFRTDQTRFVVRGR